MSSIEFDYKPSGPEVEQADHYDATFCDDLECGIHIFSYRADGTVICETILSAERTLSLLRYSQKHLYDKATRRE